MKEHDWTGSAPGDSIPDLRDLTPASAAEARALTRKALAGLPRQVVDDCQLLVSELVTNAIRHAGGLAGFGIAVPPGHVAISVRDGSDELPRVLPSAQRGQEGGYGWLLVCKLAEAITITRMAGAGKTIHASLAY